MTNTFRQWRQTMGFRNQQQAAEALGYSIARIKQWESDPDRHAIPCAVRLAMNALYHRLEPWKAEATPAG